MEHGPDSGGQHLEVCVAATAGELSGLVDRIEAYAAAAALPPKVAAQLALVCEEWAANVVEHGAAPGGVAAMRLSVRRAGAALHILAEDDGPPFDPLSAPAPDTTLPLGERASGGLGLHLIRHVVHDTRYERVGSINRLVMVIEFAS